MNILTEVMQTLNTSGIPAMRAFANTGQFDCVQVCATVGYQQVDEKGTQVLVCIFAPEELGGAICEDTAANARLSLRSMGAQCCQGRCSFDSRSRLFCVEICAAFWTENTTQT